MPAKNLKGATEEGIVCHVYNRGVENRDLFIDDADCQIFINFLEEYLSAPKDREASKKEFTVNGKIFKGLPHQPKNYFNKIELVAYSLKRNHFHLVLREKENKSLQGLIRSLCTRYSIYFNKKYDHSGPLFEGPYKSAVVTNDANLKILIRYLHYGAAHSSYQEYTGQKSTPWVKPIFIQYKDNNKIIEKFEPLEKDKVLLEKIFIEKIDDHLAKSNLGEKAESLERIIAVEDGKGLERRILREITLKPWNRTPEVIIALLIFVALTVVGFDNIKASGLSQANNTSSPAPVILGSNSASPTPEPSPAAQETKLIVTVRSDDGPVNIRKEPAIRSEKISQAQDGEKLEYVSVNDEWVEVKIQNGTTGFLSSKYIEK